LAGEAPALWFEIGRSADGARVATSRLRKVPIESSLKAR
jgi:hypothetical protein